MQATFLFTYQWQQQRSLQHNSKSNSWSGMAITFPLASLRTQSEMTAPTPGRPAPE